jgi:hypothetical protein
MYLRSHNEEETARLTLPQEGTERTKQGETKIKKNKKQKQTHTGRRGETVPQ